MENELEDIKKFLFNASPSEMRHGLVRLVDFLINNINQQQAVTSKEKSQGEKRGRKPKSTSTS